MKHIGFRMTKIEPGFIEGELDVEEIHKQQNYFVHGGVTATLADIVAGFAAFSLVKPGHGVVTADLKVSYFHPGIGQKVIARGRVEKPGSKLHFCESEIWCINNGEATLIAKATATMCVIEHKSIS